MSFRPERGPTPPLYSLLPQPMYTPPEHQHRRDDHQQRGFEPRHDDQYAQDYGRDPDPYYDRYPGNQGYDRVPQTPVPGYYGQPPYGDVESNPNGARREPYRDPPFDYRKAMRYEPRDEGITWDQQHSHHEPHHHGQQHHGPPHHDQYHHGQHHGPPQYDDPVYARSDYERYHRQNMKRHTTDRHPHNDYLWITHDGHEHGRDHQQRERYDIPVQTHPHSARQEREDYEGGHGYDTVMPAGLAYKHDVKITDLLTSITDKSEPRSAQDMMEINKGYIVVARFRAQDTADFVNAVQANVGVLSTSYGGFVMGFSEPKDMTVSIVSNDDRVINDNSWFAGPRYSACVFYFKNIVKAKDFFQETNPFKQPDFPSSEKLHVIGVPLTYGRNPEPLPLDADSSDVTLLWTEFPTISERGNDDFMHNYSEPTRQLIREYGGHPYVSVCKVTAGWPQSLNKFGQDGYRVTHVLPERAGRNIRNGWLRPESFVTVSAFHTRDQIIKLFRDPRFREKRTILQRYTRPTIIAMTLNSVKGTRSGGRY